MTTLKDVAKLANVSIATVSIYVNNKGYISPEKRERIKKAIDELNYKPNLIARILKKKISKTIGIIFTGIENPFFSCLVENAEEVAFKSGYNVILCNTEEDPKKERIYIEILKERFIDGFVIIPAIKNSKQYEILKDEKVVFVDRSSGIKNEILIKLDNIMGVKIGIEYLISLGHKRIGVINLPTIMTTGFERFEGYKKELIDNGIELDKNLIKFAKFSIESSYEKTIELLKLEKRPTAIFLMSNLITIGALKAIKDSNLKVPNDISIICFDDFPASELIEPPITTITQPVKEIAILAMEVLIRIISGKRPRKKLNVLEPKLMIRKSCKNIL